MAIKPARTEKEWKNLLRGKKRGIVRSLDDWNSLLKTSRNLLKGCDQNTIDRFTKSLLFKRGGFAHADYSMLVDKLSYRQFEALWAHFGLSMRLFADHKDYYCERRGTCAGALNRICTSNCSR